MVLGVLSTHQTPQPPPCTLDPQPSTPNPQPPTATLAVCCAVALDKTSRVPLARVLPLLQISKQANKDEFESLKTRLGAFFPDKTGQDPLAEVLPPMPTFISTNPPCTRCTVSLFKTGREGATWSDRDGNPFTSRNSLKYMIPHMKLFVKGKIWCLPKSDALLASSGVQSLSIKQAGIRSRGCQPSTPNT